MNEYEIELEAKMYKQKLIALLKALEVQDIEELIDKSTEHIIGVGLVISQ